MRASVCIRVGINGFGRMGRLAQRAVWYFDSAISDSSNQPADAWCEGAIELARVNEPQADAEADA